MNIEKVREAFEAWAADSGQFFNNYCRCDDGSYDDQELDNAWHGYRAAIYATQRDAMAVAEAVREACIAECYKMEAANMKISKDFKDRSFARLADGGLECKEAIAKIELAAIVEEVKPSTKPELVNQQLLAALKLAHDHMQLYLNHFHVGHDVYTEVTAAIRSAKETQPTVTSDEAQGIRTEFNACCNRDVCLRLLCGAPLAQPAGAPQQGEPVAWKAVHENGPYPAFTDNKLVVEVWRSIGWEVTPLVPIQTAQAVSVPDKLAAAPKQEGGE